MSWVIRAKLCFPFGWHTSLQQVFVWLVRVFAFCLYVHCWVFQFNQNKSVHPVVWCVRVYFTDVCLCHCLPCVFVLQQARAEQEEEFISNTLFKKIQALQKEKETLAVNYEKEEEFLTNELSRKLMQVSDGNTQMPFWTHRVELCFPGTLENNLTPCLTWVSVDDCW